MSARQIEREGLTLAVEELRALGDDLARWDDIQTEHARLAHVTTLLEGSHALIEGLDEGESAVSGQLGEMSARLAAMQDTMRRYGPAYIFVVRFMPGVRTPLFFAAGSLKMPYRHLFVYDGAAALVELPLLVYGVRYVGGRWQEILALMQRFQGVLLPVFILLVIGVWLLTRRRAKVKIDGKEAEQP